MKMELKNYKFKKTRVLREYDFLLDNTYLGNRAYAESWICLTKRSWPSKKITHREMALVKSYIHNKHPEDYKGCDAEITMANNFILPELAKQFGLETAEYENVIFENCDILESEENLKSDGNKMVKKIEPNINYLLTPSFLRKNERLVHLEDILESKDTLRVSKMIEQIEKSLEKYHVCEEDIEEIRETFIKQCIFNKFIGFSDEHNANAGIIFRREDRRNRARITPCYDLDFAIGIFNSKNDEIVPNYHFRLSDEHDNRNIKLCSMLRQFDGDNLRRYIESVLHNLDIEKAIELGEKRGGFTLSGLSKDKYMAFLGKSISELQQYLEQSKRNERINYEDDER